MNRFLQCTIGMGHSLVLAHVLEPGGDPEDVQEASAVRRVLHDTPVKGAVELPTSTVARPG
jgi:hypothetical protein